MRDYSFVQSVHLLDTLRKSFALSERAVSELAAQAAAVYAAPVAAEDVSAPASAAAAPSFPPVTPFGSARPAAAAQHAPPVFGVPNQPAQAPKETPAPPAVNPAEQMHLNWAARKTPWLLFGLLTASAHEHKPEQQVHERKTHADNHPPSILALLCLHCFFFLQAFLHSACAILSQELAVTIHHSTAKWALSLHARKYLERYTYRLISLLSHLLAIAKKVCRSGFIPS